MREGFGKIFLKKYLGKTFLLKGNDSATISRIEGYLLFLLNSCDLEVSREVDYVGSNGPEEDARALLISSKQNEDSKYLKRSFSLKLIRIDVREQVDPFTKNLISVGHKWREQNLTKAKKILLLPQEIDLTSKNNIQEQLLSKICGFDGIDTVPFEEGSTSLKKLKVRNNHTLTKKSFNADLKLLADDLLAEF